MVTQLASIPWLQESGYGVSSGPMKTFWNGIGVTVAHFVNVLNVTELFALKWLTSCYLKFTSIKNVFKNLNSKMIVSGSPSQGRLSSCPGPPVPLCQLLWAHPSFLLTVRLVIEPLSVLIVHRPNLCTAR